MDRETAMAKLTEGIAHLSTSTEWLAYLDIQRRFHKYSFNNTLLIGMQCPTATRVAGFKKWIEMGRMVRKGEKGIGILAPMIGRRKASGDEIVDSDEPKVIHGFGIAHVFDISQTDGDPIPEAPRVSEITGDSPQGASNALEAVARGLGYTVEFCPAREIMASGEASGICEFIAKRIRVADHLSPAGALKTLVHEIAHATLHNKRAAGVPLAPGIEHDFITRSTAELEAESVAYCVCAELGVDTSQYTFAYVTGWAGKEAVEVLRGAGSRIQHATAAILDGIAAVRGEVEVAA